MSGGRTYIIPVLQGDNLPSVVQWGKNIGFLLERFFKELSVRTDFVSPGSILIWGGSAPPSTYYTCNGEEKSRTQDVRLFRAIGTTWGAGNGVSTFNLPDSSQLPTLTLGSWVIKC